MCQYQYFDNAHALEESSNQIINMHQCTIPAVKYKLDYTKFNSKLGREIGSFCQLQNIVVGLDYIKILTVSISVAIISIIPIRHVLLDGRPVNVWPPPLSDPVTRGAGLHIKLCQQGSLIN